MYKFIGQREQERRQKQTRSINQILESRKKMDNGDWLAKQAKLKVESIGWGEGTRSKPRSPTGLGWTQGWKLAASKGGWEGGTWESGRSLIQPEDQPHFLPLLKTRSSPSQKVTGRLWTWGISSAKMRPRPLSPQVAHKMLATGWSAISMPPSPFRSGSWKFFFFPLGQVPGIKEQVYRDPPSPSREIVSA